MKIQHLTAALTLLALGAVAPTAHANELDTGFEFIDLSGSFSLGTAPFTATYVGGMAKSVGNFSLYHTGFNSWMVDNGVTANIAFEVPADSVELWFKDQSGGVNSQLSFLAPGGGVLQSFAGSTTWQKIVVAGPIGSIRLQNNAPLNGYAVIDDMSVDWFSAGSYCTGGTTASGCNAAVSATGTPSATASSGFDVIVGAVEGNKDGILFFGTNGRQANSWGNGTSLQCVVPPVKRTGLLVGIGTPGTCDGSLTLDFNAWMTANPGKAPAAGSIVDMQCWFRDPQNTSNQTTSLSDAIEFCVAP